MDIREVVEQGGKCVESEIVDTLKAGQWYEFAETWELPDGRQFLFHCQGFHPKETKHETLAKRRTRWLKQYPKPPPDYKVSVAYNAVCFIAVAILWGVIIILASKAF